MNKEILINSEITLDENYIRFDNLSLELEDIESVNCLKEPRRNPFLGLKEWLYGFLFLMIVNIFHELKDIIANIYCLLLPIIIIYNIYMFVVPHYRLVIRTKSGQEYYKISINKNKQLLIKNNIDISREKIKNKRIPNISFTNNGIISSGDNAKNQVVNKIINKKTYINYKLLEEELTILLKKASEKDIIKEAIIMTKEKKYSKLKKCLSKLGKETLLIIKELGLITLGKYIEMYITK